MRILSMKEFSEDLLKTLLTTADGLCSLISVIFFVVRSLVLFFAKGGPPYVLVEGLLYSLIVLLMLVRLRFNATAPTKTSWGGLVSVLAFDICILILR